MYKRQAYTLPSKLEDYVVMRVVVRQGFSRDMADMLLGDIKNAITELEKLDYPTPTRICLLYTSFPRYQSVGKGTYIGSVQTGSRLYFRFER